MKDQDFPLNISNCQQVRQVLDNMDLSHQPVLALTKHCEQCAACQQYRENLLNLRYLLSSQVKVAVPRDFDIRLRQRIVAQQAREVPWWQWMQKPLLATATAAALLVVALIGLDRLPSHFSQPPSDSAKSISQPLLLTTTGSKDSNENNLASTASNNSKGTELGQNSNRGDNSASSNLATALPSRVAPNSNRVRKDDAESIDVKEFIAGTNPNAKLVKRDLGNGQVLIEIRDQADRLHTVPIEPVVYGTRPVVSFANDANNGSADQDDIF